jgi:hypothetical protein
MTYKILGILKSLKYFIQTMEFGASHLNSLKKLLSLKKLPHPNTLLSNKYVPIFLQVTLLNYP